MKITFTTFEAQFIASIGYNIHCVLMVWEAEIWFFSHKKFPILYSPFPKEDCWLYNLRKNKSGYKVNFQDELMVQGVKKKNAGKIILIWKDRVKIHCKTADLFQIRIILPAFFLGHPVFHNILYKLGTLKENILKFKWTIFWYSIIFCIFQFNWLIFPHSENLKKGFPIPKMFLPLWNNYAFF